MVLKGNSVSPGIALGTIYTYTTTFETPKECFINSGEEELNITRYEAVKKQALTELEVIIHTMEKKDPERAKIFRAHQDIVNDVAINEEIPDKILKEHWSGDWALYKTYETFIRMVRKAPDPIIAERASDFEDVRERLLKIWYNKNTKGLSNLDKPVIVAAKELFPSDTATMDHNNVLAILTETGGVTSHSAIIAKSFGIPAVLGIQELLKNVQQGQTAVVDAEKGIIHLNPDNTMTEEYTKKYKAWKQQKETTETYRNKKAFTKDKIRIEIGVNIANADEKELEASEYTDSIGLFRTEFLYMGRDKLPGEEEQFLVYRKVLERFGDKPVILRTLDIGGDKTLKSMELPLEENPFLGNRALRLCFSHPELFVPQLRACLRAAVYGNLWIMLPMVSSVDDIRKAKEYINKVQKDLQKENKPCGKFKIGIMVEIPSIALIADHAAKEIDFASIGSNDLCQYLCAADRMNSTVESYYQSYHPALFRLIKETSLAFNNAGKPVSICGELGSDPLAVPVLIGLGIKKFSMGSALVAGIKQVISDLTMKKAREMAEKVLELDSASAIEEYLTKEGKCINEQ